MNIKNVYLDNNATTIVDPLVKEAMLPFFDRYYGNPGSLHSYGMEVRKSMEKAINQIYGGVNASDDDTIIVNSCATEGNNTVLKSVWFDLIRTGKKKQIITSPTEHPAITNTVGFLKELGAEVIILPVNKQGIVTTEILAEYIDSDKTALVSLMWANNETGLINPIEELSSLCREKGVLFHTDGVQAVGKIEIDLSRIPVDFLTFSGHKFHAPKGVGGLYIRKGVSVVPLLHGGGQMGGIRSGTENVPFFIALAEAIALATKDIENKNRQIASLRNRLEDVLLTKSKIKVLGAREMRTSNTILCSIKGTEGESLIWDLNRQGVAASTGSACSSASLKADASMMALGLTDDLAHTSVRFSLSRFTTEAEIDHTIQAVESSIERLREISGFST